MQLPSSSHKCIPKKDSTYKNVNMKCALEWQMIASMHSFTSHGNSSNVQRKSIYLRQIIFPSKYYLQESSTSVLLQKPWQLSHKCNWMISVDFYVLHKSRLTLCRFSGMHLCPNYRLMILQTISISDKHFQKLYWKQIIRRNETSDAWFTKYHFDTFLLCYTFLCILISPVQYTFHYIVLDLQIILIYRF